MTPLSTLVRLTDGPFEGRAAPGASERYGEDRIARWLEDQGSNPIDGSVIDWFPLAVRGPAILLHAPTSRTEYRVLSSRGARISALRARPPMRQGRRRRQLRPAKAARSSTASDGPVARSRISAPECARVRMAAAC